ASPTSTSTCSSAPSGCSARPARRRATRPTPCRWAGWSRSTWPRPMIRPVGSTRSTSSTSSSACSPASTCLLPATPRCVPTGAGGRGVNPKPLSDERISTAVGKIQLWRGGQGEALVYLHSAAGEAAATPLLEELADSFDVIAPVFPGFGESEGMDEIDDIEDAAFHLLDVWDQLGLAAPAVVGTSLGGWMAAELATRNPEKVGSLVLVNPAGLYIEGAPVGEIFGRPPNELARDLFADESHPFVVAADQMSEMANMKVELPFEL